MPKIPKLLPTLLVCGLAAGSLAAPAALASHRQTTYFEGVERPAQRQDAPARARADAGARRQSAARGALLGRRRARARPAPPCRAFDATNPAIYAWGEYDALIAEAQRLHWKVLLTVTSPVPRWATSNKKAPYVTKPDPKAFQEFMTAVGRHYGSQVSLFSIWNEPNHPAFLLPQWNTNGTPASPRIYRGLYQAGYAGLQAAGIANPKVLFGETAPTGYEQVNVQARKIAGRCCTTSRRCCSCAKRCA